MDTEKIVTATDQTKVTMEDVRRAVKGETYTVLPDGRTTVCQLTLDNGFTVTGESACVHKDNFVKELGEQAAREKAIDKVWAFLGFRKAEELNKKEPPKTTYLDRLIKERDELEKRVGILSDTLSDAPAYIQLRSTFHPVQEKLMREQLTCMRHLLTVLNQRLNHIEYLRLTQQAGK